jgi:hypothetical protein
MTASNSVIPGDAKEATIEDYRKARKLNRGLTTAVKWAGVAALVGILVGVSGWVMRPAAEKWLVDPGGRFYKPVMLESVASKP